MTVSGTSNGEPESINDGDETTKWDSDLIKGEEATSEEAWFAIDLGEQTNLIDGLKVSYFNKVYPINYEVQVSNDNKTWTTVKTLTREHDGEAHPKDDIQFETPVSARYVKMLFKEMNSAKKEVMALESMMHKLSEDMYMKMRAFKVYLETWIFSFRKTVHLIMRSFRL